MKTIVANWKMNLGIRESVAQAKGEGHGKQYGKSPGSRRNTKTIPLSWLWITMNCKDGKLACLDTDSV